MSLSVHLLFLLILDISLPFFLFFELPDRVPHCASSSSLAILFAIWIVPVLFPV